MNDTIQRLVEWLNNASPIVWQAAYRQVWIDGIENLILFGVTTVVGIWGFRLLRKNWDDLEEGALFGSLGVIVAGILSAVFLTCVIDCFVNPTFQAIKNLAGLVARK
jgi:hypothetical protein